jgi:hypothetical protein
MGHWADVKSEFEDLIKDAKITNPEFIKTLMMIARRVNTCKNMLAVNKSWEYVTSSKQFYEACDGMYLLNGNGYLHNKREAKFWNEWEQFCDANGWSKDGNIGDWLA